MYSYPFRFPNSSLGLPIFFLRIVKTKWKKNMPLMTAHQTDRIITHSNWLCFFAATQSTSLYHVLIIFQWPIRSPTRAFVTIIIVLCWGDILAWSSRYMIKIHVWFKPRQAKFVMMSDLIKAQNTPQLNWYTHWTFLGAYGMPDNLIRRRETAWSYQVFHQKRS